MATLIIVTGPAASGKTHKGKIWVAKSPETRIRIEATPRNDAIVRSALRKGKDVWLEVLGVPGVVPRHVEALEKEAAKVKRYSIAEL